ncbi:MAG: hypothetical protein MUP40_00035 [Actinobacteria bacterium]|nr:hypothetical protein [Actinomycetota bacterium]
MEEPVNKFKPKDLLEHIKQIFAVERVYGEPIETMGKTIIPVAQIAAGGGGGGGEGEGPVDAGQKTPGEGKEEAPSMGTGTGMGFGFGGSARPIGFMVVEGDQTTWVPTVHPEKIALKSISVGMALVKMMVKIINKRSGARGREKGK